MSWPWKKKLSDRSAAEKAIATLDSAGVSLASVGSINDKDNYKKPSYVQISVESYAHLTGLEEQVKMYEEQVGMYEDQLKTLDEQVDDLNEKLSAAHAEMDEKEELVKQHSKVAEEAVCGWEKAEAEAATLKTNLEAVTLSKLTAEDRAAHLDGALKECMRQIRNLKEEHEQKVQDIITSKNTQYDKMKRDFEAKISHMDHEIRRAGAESDTLSRSLQERSSSLFKMTEEKSQAEAEIEILKSNLENSEREINSLKYELHIVSKELEIRNEEKNMGMKSVEAANKQQMEGIKKIMKLEAECQRLRNLVKKKLPGPGALAQMRLEVESMGRDYREPRRGYPGKSSSPVTEFSHDNSQKLQRENEFLSERLLAMEDETKMLKEALANRNSELQASRSMYARTANKLQGMEARSFSEDGNDDAASVAESWASAPVSEFSHVKDKNKDKSSRAESTTSQLELMDDFLEMEKLAHSSKDCKEDKKADAVDDADSSLLKKVQNRISKILESVTNDSDIGKALEEIKHVVKEVQDNLYPHPVNCVFVEKHCSEDAVVTPSSVEEILSKELDAAISVIHAFMVNLGKEAAAFQGASDDEDGLIPKVELFSASYNKVLRNETSLTEFLVSLSNVVGKVRELSLNFVGYKNCEIESNALDCIDKVALPENKEDKAESFANGCSNASDSSSNPEVPSEAILPQKDNNLVEKMKAEKDDVERELARSTDDLEVMKSRLKESEELVTELRSEVAASLKSNSLAETQLKCMAESYKSLEKRAEELESEVGLLRTKVEAMELELQSEKAEHEEALARCKDLEEQLQRNEECSTCASLAAEIESKSKQEKELAAAAEKLAECQETIFLLGRQLKAFHPPPSDSNSAAQTPAEEHQITDQTPTDQAEMDTATSPNAHNLGAESPADTYTTPYSPYEPDPNPSGPGRSRAGSRTPPHRPPQSGSSSAASTPTPEKHSRGFSRFFSSKGSTRH